MSNIRKISHRPRADGSVKESWRATYVAPDGQRRSKNHPKKADAQAWLREQDLGRSAGSPTMTVAQLGAAHLKYFETLVAAGVREKGTADGYSTVLALHVQSDIAFAKTTLAELTTPKAQAFLHGLFERCGSLDITSRVRRTLVTWCELGQRRGWLTSNPAKPCKVEKTTRTDAEDDGCDIPAKAELGRLITAAAQGAAAARDIAVARLLMFGGFRISELLGAADEAVAVGKTGVSVKVKERLERRYIVLGAVKSAKGRRTVPLGQAAAVAVKAWRLARGPARGFGYRTLQDAETRATGRLFPNPDGGPLWGYDDFMRDCWLPMMRRAGLVAMEPDGKGKNRPVPAFTPHTLRHVAASLWIEQGLPPKKVQELLGHSTLQLTMDLYGHLWRDDAADDALAQASERLITAGS